MPEKKVVQSHAMHRLEEIFLALLILLAVLDFFEILPGDLDYVKKIISWTIIGYLIYKASLTRMKRRWQARSRAKPFTSLSRVAREGLGPRSGLGVAMERRRWEAVLARCGAVSVQRADISAGVIRRVGVPLRFR